MSVECVVVCLRVCYGYGFLGFDIGDFWDCFYWTGNRMDRGVCRRAVSNDFVIFFGVRDLVVRFLVIGDLSVDLDF